MTSFSYSVGEKSEAAVRFISRVRSEVQRAFATEKSRRRLTQQQIANVLGVNRSVINRQLMGLDNMTLRSVAELLWAIGWEPHFSAAPMDADDTANYRELSRELNQELGSQKTDTGRAAFEIRPDA